ncbi:MAG: aminotransferase class I/II-fold pyridoxal phosphate-dependent enzyme [Dehalococcoidia bacterium]
MSQTLQVTPQSDIDIRQALSDLLRRWFQEREAPPFVAGETRIPLNVPGFGWEEVTEALDSLLSARTTMGHKVRCFEELFAAYVGVRHAVMVNSGSSANLLALSVLANPALDGHVQPGDEVITPALTWATTVFPIVNAGAVPILVDVELDTFNLDPDAVERAITARTRAIMPVHLLGRPCDMERIQAIARRHNLYLIEDCCEAHGAETAGRRVGGFGDLATFSFFFTHHISTMEGGMLLTNNGEYADLARALRVFGWVRDRSDAETIARRHPEIDSRFLFTSAGYNLRPTELQGAFGIHQIGKLDGFIEARRQNARYWRQRLAACSEHLLIHDEAPGTRHVWFGYPLTVREGAPFSRRELVDHLEARGLETRPIMAGDISQQPAMRLLPHRVAGELTNARHVHENGFFFGNHQGIGPAEREAIAGYIEEFVRKHTRGRVK